MKIMITAEGKIINASDVLADHLIKKGGRELKLQTIKTPNIYGDETRGGDGISELPKPKRSRKPRRSEG
jgi:hypothetical protein